MSKTERQTTVEELTAQLKMQPERLSSPISAASTCCG